MNPLEQKETVVPIAAQKLIELFSQNRQKRICVVGTSCVGKSTLLRYIPEAVDMDELLFGNEQKAITPLLTPQEREYVCGPWTPKVGEFMEQKAREYIQIEPGRPVFGTIIFPCDLIVELSVPDHVLQERVRMRNANEQDVFNLKAQIASKIKRSGIATIVVENV